MKCPCTNCICIPICRYKLFRYVFRDCKLANEYVENYGIVHKRDVIRMKELVAILKPAHWKYEMNYNHNNRYPVIDSVGDVQTLAKRLRPGDEL
jgi:hypothetical protein